MSRRRRRKRLEGMKEEREKMSKKSPNCIYNSLMNIYKTHTVYT